MKAIYFVLPVLIILMFGLGLDLRRKDFIEVLARPKALIAGMFAQTLLLPLIAFGLVIVLKIEPLMSLGIVLIACCPGGSSSNILTMLSGGDIALSITMTAISSFIGVLTIPLILSFSSLYFLSSEAVVVIPFNSIFVQLILVIIVPVSTGMMLRYLSKNYSEKLNVIIRKISFPMLLMIILIFTFKQYQVILKSAGILLAATSLLLILTMAAGKIVALLVKVSRKRRKAIVIEIGIQNAALAITIAASPLLLNNEKLAVPAIIYAVLMNAVVLGYVGFLRYSTKHINANPTL